MSSAVLFSGVFRLLKETTFFIKAALNSVFLLRSVVIALVN